MTERWLSRNTFARMTDIDLASAAGFSRRGVNAGRANREMRRRAARSGSGDVFAWLHTIIGSVTQ